MSAAPRFTVVMPLWNKEREVARAVTSVLSQQLGELELLVVDDGSTDGSRAAVEAIHDPRLRLLTQSNAGVSAARNAGIARATAPAIAFLDADDEWLPDFLERVARLMARHPQAGVFTVGYLVDMGGGRRAPARIAGLPRRFDGLVPDYFQTAGLNLPSSTVVRRQAFATVGTFRVGLAFGEDLDMWMRLAARFEVAFDPGRSVVWHCEASNRACERKRGSSAQALLPSLESLERSPDLPDRVKRSARLHVGRIGLNEIERLLARGQPEEARVLLRLWRQSFTPDGRYRLLCLASGFPRAPLRWLGRAGARAKALAGR